jgi:pimeloyl-ACP methyl ester carboxylesterase
MEVHPFKLDIPQEQLDDLRARLAATRWPDELPDADWDYGAPLEHVRALADHWRDGYDWRAQERRLNAWPHFSTEIDGAHVHFLHVRSPEPDALPLIMTHGWPGSIVEFLYAIGPLTDPRAHGGDPADAFHLVVPSIPGFGLSGPTPDRGWDVRRIARAWGKLMRGLGYERYGAQGGDWGSRITWELGRAHPESVVAAHVNMLVAEVPADVSEDDLTDEERALLERRNRFVSQGTGYMLQQSTRPQTLAYALADSPVGQLAWIAEKLTAWTDPAKPVSRDDLLTNVMLYWLTNTAGSSARIYYEFTRTRAFGMPEPTTTPTGVAVFAYDIAQPLRRFAERDNSIVHWSAFERGGHFAALEQPDLLVGDVRTFFRAFR